MLRLAQYCDNSFGLRDLRRSGAEIAPQCTRLHLKARALLALRRALGTPHEIPHPPAPKHTRLHFKGASVARAGARAGDPALLLRPISARSGEPGAKIGLLVFGMTTVRAVTIICEAQ